MDGALRREADTRSRFAPPCTCEEMREPSDSARERCTRKHRSLALYCGSEEQIGDPSGTRIDTSSDGHIDASPSRRKAGRGPRALATREAHLQARAAIARLARPPRTALASPSASSKSHASQGAERKRRNERDAPSPRRRPPSHPLTLPRVCRKARNGQAGAQGKSGRAQRRRA